jgi:predicted NAD/FAD-binding protein
VLGVTHAATLYEANGRLGGHAPTADVPSGDRTLRIGSGLIVHKELSRATLLRLLPLAERVRTAVPPRPLAPGGATA